MYLVRAEKAHNGAEIGGVPPAGHGDPQHRTDVSGVAFPRLRLLFIHLDLGTEAEGRAEGFDPGKPGLLVFFRIVGVLIGGQNSGDIGVLQRFRIDERGGIGRCIKVGGITGCCLLYTSRCV